MREISLKELLEAGCHFGHQTNRWHPKAAKFIYGSRDGVHVIDLAQTKNGLQTAAQFLKDLAQNNGSVLIVGTKRQARPIVEENINRIKEAVGDKNNFYFLLERWPGGLLTNFETIKRNNLDAILRLNDDIQNNNFVTKKEKLLAQRLLNKYNKVYGGLVGLTKIPDAILLIDIKKDLLAVKEATRTATKIVAISDTNTDPNLVDIAIPANDDAVGSIKILLDYLTDAWIEGRQSVKEEPKLPETQKV